MTPTEARPLAGARETEEWPELEAYRRALLAYRAAVGQEGGVTDLVEASRASAFEDVAARLEKLIAERAARGGARETERRVLGHLWVIVDSDDEVVSVVFPQGAQSAEKMAERMSLRETEHRAVYVELVSAEATVKEKSG